jgi:hypothetical protein
MKSRIQIYLYGGKQARDIEHAVADKFLVAIDALAGVQGHVALDEHHFA